MTDETPTFTLDTGNEIYLTIDPDGKITLGKNVVTVDEASKKFWECVLRDGQFMFDAAVTRGKVAGLRDGIRILTDEAKKIAEDLDRGKRNHPDDTVGHAQLSAMIGAVLTSAEDLRFAADKLEQSS